MKLITVAVVLGSTLSLIACAPDGRGDDGLGDDGSGSGSGSGSGTVQRCTKMDIVFVVDDSGSMSEEQGNLGSNFPMFADLLLNYVNADGEHIDFRVAVTTTGKTVTTNTTINLLGMMQSTTITEMGDNGAFRKNCNVAKSYLEPTDPNLGSTLGCRANVGTGGPGTEMPMMATKLALVDRVMDGTNAGFLRDDALLGVVMLTDEDDSSTTQSTINITVDISNPNGATPVTDYNPPDFVQTLDAIKGNRSRWAAGVIAGPSDCMSNFGKAVKATRLQEFVSLSGTQGVFSSICEGNLTAGLQQVVEKFQSACGGIIL